MICGQQNLGLQYSFDKFFFRSQKNLMSQSVDDRPIGKDLSNRSKVESNLQCLFECYHGFDRTNTDRQLIWYLSNIGSFIAYDRMDKGSYGNTIMFVYDGIDRTSMCSNKRAIVQFYDRIVYDRTVI